MTAVVDPKRLTWVEDALIDPATHTTTFTILPDHYAGLLERRRNHHPRRPSTAGARAGGPTGEVKVHVPFVGGKVEAAIISGLRDYAAMEAEALDRWVADQRPRADRPGPARAAGRSATTKSTNRR